MYAEFSGDPVIQSMAFEDQRHYVVLLCLKCSGVLDRDVPTEALTRIVLRGLGLDPVAGSEAKRRLLEVGLIDDSWQPCAWERRQYRSDSSTERVREYRKRSSNVSETDQIQIQKQTQKEKNTVGQKPDDAKQVLEFLNQKTGRHYEPVKANLQLITARLKEGASVDDLRAVVAKKCREWAGDPKMAQYLRPATLFNATKFAQYAGELGGKDAA